MRELAEPENQFSAPSGKRSFSGQSFSRQLDRSIRASSIGTMPFGVSDSCDAGYGEHATQEGGVANGAFMGLIIVHNVQ
jgi:hypothetical protein